MLVIDSRESHREKSETLSTDARNHLTTARWRSGCDDWHWILSRGFLFCSRTARVASMDVARDGPMRDFIDTGVGLYNIDYLPADALTDLD